MTSTVARIPLFLPPSIPLNLIRNGISSVSSASAATDIFTFDEQAKLLSSVSGVSTVTQYTGTIPPQISPHDEYYKSRSLQAKSAFNRALAKKPLFDVEATKKPSPISITDKYLIPTSTDFHSVLSRKPPNSDSSRIVYVSGSFDILTPACIRFLELSKSYGTKIIVGIYSDYEITKVLSINSRLMCGLKPFEPFLTAVPSDNPFPIFSVQERALNLMCLDVVDDVVMDVPILPEAEMLRRLNVGVVGVDGRRDEGGLWRKEEFQGGEGIEVVRIDNEGDMTEIDVLQKV
ncbi:hypothetical protein TrVE_jg7118 [Triparma verrucosa]|uniref:Uncharacterized protein n=1 Tax=Triparma verrucosa TaxID=1606542 RepID=A0A9W7B4N4_9STRA|nr:hypothetical protein TrVE_jg7118 [Triparma verrucosa]